METKHTPGPWKFQVLESQKNHMGQFTGRDGTVVCSFGDSTTYYPEEGEPPCDADIALIEAAPVLLNACMEAVAEMRDSLACPSNDWDCFDKLCAAITKATGKE